MTPAPAAAAKVAKAGAAKAKAEKALSPIQAAAGQMLDKAKPAGAAGGDAKPPTKSKYPSPKKYKGHEWAVSTNHMLDQLDATRPGETPAATRFMLSESAMATAEAMSGHEIDIHPGYLLAFSLAAYTGVCLMHFFRDQPDAPNAAGNRFADRGAGDAPAEGNRFARPA